MENLNTVEVGTEITDPSLIDSLARVDAYEGGDGLLTQTEDSLVQDETDFGAEGLIEAEQATVQ